MNRNFLYLAAFGLIAFGLYRKRDEIKEIVQSGVEYIMNATRGERNNNPGNIEKSNTNWVGKISGSDSRFESFQSAEYGIRAIARLLQTYIRKGDNTIERIINRYAPASENDSRAYIESVSSYTGIPAGQLLAPDDEESIRAITTAIIRHENGRISYSPEIIALGVSMAFA